MEDTTQKKLLNKPFGLIIIQPTSFCNIDCDYCYLSSSLREEKGKMEDNVLHSLSQKIFTSKLIEHTDYIRFTWHSGEPMALPITFYENAISIINKYKLDRIEVYQEIVTNGTLISDKWALFFEKFNFNVCISIDGPEFLHNYKRKNRSGKGTFDKAIKGLQTLQKYNINYYILTTITDKTLDYPDELFQFYLDNNIKNIGFNFEEIVGNNKYSTIAEINKYRDKANFFLNRLYQLTRYNKTIKIREFELIHGFVFYANEYDSLQGDSISPMSILSVDKNGNYGTFSQELIDMKHNRYENFILGNVLTDDIDSVFDNAKFNQMHSEIMQGVDNCKNTCDYYDVCGGGMPSSKLSAYNLNPSEGYFDATETIQCIMSVKTVADIVLDNLEQNLFTPNL